MRKLLGRMFEKLFCLHDWEETHDVKVYGNREDPPTKIVCVYLCRKCGRFKKLVFVGGNRRQ